MTVPRYLRPDLPSSYPFSVEQKTHTAKLDQNEAPMDLPQELKRELVDELCKRPWNRYVQPAEYVEAKESLADVVGIAPERLAITAGADQGLVATAAIAGGPGRRIRWFEPTYPYVGHAARMSRGHCEAVSLGADIDAAMAAVEIDAADLVYFVSPNNPTGGLVDESTIRRALAVPDRLVVVDEAYFDFSKVTVAGLLREHENLVVVRSLSKSLLAAVHVGYVMGSPDTVAHVERLFTAPYHLTAQQLLVCQRYGELRPHVLGLAEVIRKERARVSAALAELEIVEHVYPSQANFVLFRLNVDAGALAVTLADRGIRLRDVSGLPGLEGHLRVTLGTREENDAFLAALSA